MRQKIMHRYVMQQFCARILRKLWQILPPAARELPLRCLTKIIVGKRSKTVRVEDGCPVYIFGAFQAGGGLSRSAQLYVSELRKNNQNCICVDTTEKIFQAIKVPTVDGFIRTIDEIREDFGSGIIVIHHNPPQFQWILCGLGRKFLQHKRIVSYWAWELEDLPPLWKHALHFVDAIEVPSTFTKIAVARNTHKPVVVHPHAVEPPKVTKDTFSQDGILRCLFVFDLASLYGRKNPEAAIQAFSRAFEPGEATLTVKLSQPQAYPEDFTRLENLVKQHKHVRLIVDWLDEAALHRLYLEHDVYLSLHRSEGYGLTIREAMLHKLCVVATGWSGNMDFMNSKNVFSVPCILIPVDKSLSAFQRVPHARWAEADVEAAANVLRDIRKRLLQGRLSVNAEATV